MQQPYLLTVWTEISPKHVTHHRHYGTLEEAKDAAGGPRQWKEASHRGEYNTFWRTWHSNTERESATIKVEE